MGLLKDGYQTLLSVAGHAKKYKVISITPPALDGRGPIDQTNMESIVTTQKSAKALLDVGNISVTIAYDSKEYDFTDAAALSTFINVVGVEWDLTFPDGTNVQFLGYLNAFRPGEHSEGNRPTAVLEVVVTNETFDGVQRLPIWTDA